MRLFFNFSIYISTLY